MAENGGRYLIYPPKKGEPVIKLKADFSYERAMEVLKGLNSKGVLDKVNRKLF